MIRTGLRTVPMVPESTPAPAPPKQGFAPEGKCTRVGRYWVAPVQAFAPGAKRVDTHYPSLICSGIGFWVSGILKKAGTTNVLIPTYPNSTYCIPASNQLFQLFPVFTDLDITLVCLHY